VNYTQNLKTSCKTPKYTPTFPEVVVAELLFVVQEKEPKQTQHVTRSSYNSTTVLAHMLLYIPHTLAPTSLVQIQINSLVSLPGTIRYEL